MGLSIRRGTTKTFALRIPPYKEDPDGSVETYNDLPVLTPEDEGKIYRVGAAYGDYPSGSYYLWNGSSWIFIGFDKKWKDLGTLHVRILQGNLILDKKFENVDSNVARVTYTQDETIQLQEKKAAKLQVFCVEGSIIDENAIKSQTYGISITDSLWDEAVHNE